MSKLYKLFETETQSDKTINQNHNGQQIASNEKLLKTFWDWFDGSATVDDQGRPIVFYHGSPFKFDKFNTKYTFLSTSFKFAHDYAADKSFEQQLDMSPKVYDCYLKLKNPLNIGSEKGIATILAAIKGQEIRVYGRNFSERDLKIALEGKTPYNFIENFDETKIGDYIYPLNKESTSYMVGNDDYMVVQKTPNNIYAIRLKDDVLSVPRHMWERDPKTIYEVTRISNNVTTPIPEKAERYKPTGGVYISVSPIELKQFDGKTLAQKIDVSKLNFNENGEAVVQVPFKIKGSFITGYDKFSEEQEIGLVGNVEVRIYTNKENAKLTNAGNTWGTVENMEIGNKMFFDFLHNIGFDAIYIMENGVLNVCVFDNTDIKLTSDFRTQKDSSTTKELTETIDAQGKNVLGIVVSPFLSQMQKLDAELDNLEAIYGLDVTKSSRDLESSVYDYLLEKRFEDEQKEYQTDEDMRREYFENMYGDIESAIDELSDGEEMDEDTFLNTIGKDFFDDYAVNELQTYQENNQFDEDLMREVDTKIWDAREKFMEPRIALIRSIFNQNGFELDVDSSRISDSTYFTLSKETDEDIFYGDKIRWSDHADHYGSRYHIWFSDKLSEIIPNMIEWWSEDYNDFLKTHKPLTEASNPVQTNLINQNHLGNPIAKDEESLKRFWKWFGKSAAIDQKGRPFVFYHGSAYTFSKFDANQIIGQLEDDKAVFFSTSKKFAEEFGSDRVEYQNALEIGDEDAHEGSLNIPSDEDDYIDKEHLYECYLRVKNPFNPKNKNHINLFIQWVRQNVPADVLSNYNINFDLLKSSLSGTYPMNYTNDINSLNLYDVIKISAYADSKPVETVLRNQNPNNQIDKSLWQSGFHTYAQVFHKGKRSALAFSVSVVDLKSLIELAKNYSKNNKFEINLKVSPAMVADRVMRAGVKFSDAVSKKVPASFPVEISWGTRVKKRELLTVPVNVVVWSITEKDNARTKSYDSIWEEMESLIIGEDYSFVGILKALGFDSFYTYEESYLNLAVFDPKNIKSIDNVGKWGRGKNIYESVLCERLIGDAGSAKLIDEPDYNKAVEKLIAAYNAGETDCYIKTDIEFQDVHEISTNPQEIDVPDEQRQHKTRKLTIILGLDDIQAKDEARKVSELMEKHFDEYKEYDGSGLRHVETHIDSIRDYLESLPEEEKEAIGYETLKTKERGVMLAWLKALPNLFKKSALQLKERNSYRQKTIFVYGSFILVIGLEDKPTSPFKARAKAYQNDFNYIVTFYKATPNYIDKIISLHEKYMDYKLSVEQGGVQPDAERKFVHLSSLVKKQIGVETVVLKRKITK